MQDFLNGYVERTSSDDIGQMVNEMQAVDDDWKADSALWKHWCESVEKGMEMVFETKMKTSIFVKSASEL